MALKYANTEIDFTVERLVDIASRVIDGLLQDDEASAIEYLVDQVEMDEYEMKFLAALVKDKHGNYKREDDCCNDYDYDDDDYYDDEEEWRNDSYVSCSDCPDDECTGNCMSCSYRPV